jgi:cell division protease FtsH
MRRFFRSAAFPILIVIVLAFFAQRLISPSTQEETPDYSQFINQVRHSPTSIKDVTVQQKTNTLHVTETDGTEYTTGYPADGAVDVTNILRRYNIDTTVEGTGGSSFLSILTYILPFVLFFGFWLFLMNQMQGGGSRVMSFGKSRAKRMSVDAPKITFRDVAGVDEAVQELHEIKEFLENPKKFQALGARRSPARRGCRSSRSPAPTSSRCSWASAQAGCATCSSRQSRTRPASSSWTRSTPSAATAGRGWAAVTTSASRP